MEVGADARRWVEAETGARITSAAAMAGATSSEVHELALSTGAAVVLRRYTNAAWLGREPDLAEHDAAVLELLAGSGVPAPELIAVDPDGSRCGAPAVLATRLAGRPMPDAEPSRLAAAAAQSVAIHQVAPLPGWQFARYNPDPGGPPPWSRRPELWTAAFAAAADPPPGERCFIHRDYHYGNVLWDGGKLAGVVDWVNGCAGPAGIDVARYRLNLAFDHGPEAADAFTAAYETASGESHDPGWDVIDAVDCPPYYEGEAAVAAWPDGGWPIEVRGRLEDFLAAALAEVG